jgi:competence protein ComEC
MQYSLLLPVLLCFILLAWFRAEIELGRDIRWSIQELAQSDSAARITGRVCVPASDSRDFRYIIIDRAEIKIDERLLALDALRVRVFCDSLLLSSLQYGDIIHAVGQLRSGSEKAARFTGTLTGLLARREAGDFFVDTGLLFTTPVEGHFLRRAVDSARLWITNTFNRYLSADAAALCRALVLGDRQDFSYQFQEQLRLTGLSHIFALSGLNTGLIISLLWVFLGLFFLPRNARYWILLLCALFYMELGREVPSLVRATLMSSIFLIGRLLQRKTHVLNYVAAALGIELLWRPMDIVDPGFALSYLAVLGMVVGYQAMKQTVIQLIGDNRDGILKSATDVLSGTFTAQIGTLPLVGFLFHRFPLIGALGNLLIVPGFAVMLILASVMLLIAGVIPWAVQYVTPSIEYLTMAMGSIVSFFASLPLSGIQFQSMTLGLMILIYAVIFSFLVAWMLKRTRSALLIVAAFSCFVVWWSAFQEPENPQLSFIDVGNGDAILVEDSDRRLLIDAGPQYGEWSAAQNILPYFSDRGIAHLDGLILTHPDTDHLGGAADLLQRMTVDRVWTNQDSSQSFAYLELSLVFEQLNMRPSILRAGDQLRLGNGTDLFVLTPDSLSMLRGQSSNQKSLAIKLESENNSALFAADIDSTVELGLLMWGDLLDSDLLCTGHHGSKASTCLRFLQACSPDLCIMTAGRRNPYGHPHPDVLARLDSLEIPYSITGREGTLVFESTDSGWRRVKPPAQSLAELWHLPYG